MPGRENALSAFTEGVVQVSADHPAGAGDQPEHC
jgi:hypothetical protein